MFGQIGNRLAVIGHNGAGKSTFARSLCGLERGATGEVVVKGRPLNRQDRLKRCYMVMQDVNHQLFAETVLDEVLLSMAEEDGRKAEETLRALDLLHMKELHPLSLSGGQKQRVAIPATSGSKPAA